MTPKNTPTSLYWWLRESIRFQLGWMGGMYSIRVAVMQYWNPHKGFWVSIPLYKIMLYGDPLLRDPANDRRS